jgi:hypothetical protein
MKTGRDAHVLIPPALVTKLQAVADQEHRSTADVVADALEGYLEARRWQLDAEQELAHARALGLPDDDVPLIPEYRESISAKITQGAAPCVRGRARTAKPSAPGWRRNSTSLSGKDIGEALHPIA